MTLLLCSAGVLYRNLLVTMLCVGMHRRDSAMYGFPRRTVGTRYSLRQSSLKAPQKSLLHQPGWWERGQDLKRRRKVKSTVGCARFFAHHFYAKQYIAEWWAKEWAPPYTRISYCSWSCFWLLFLCRLPKIVSLKGQNHRDVILRAAKPGRRIRPTREKSNELTED